MVCLCLVGQGAHTTAKHRLRSCRVASATPPDCWDRLWLNARAERFSESVWIANCVCVCARILQMAVVRFLAICRFVWS